MPELNLLHVVGGAHMGYGRMGVYLAKCAREQGVTVYDSIADSPHAVSTSHLALEFTGDRTPGVSNIICWASVPTHARGWWEGQIPCILTMWESTELPESFRENLHEFDTIVVPSLQNVELFSQYHDNVKYVPLGVDPQRWHFRERKTPTTRFNFMIGGSGGRKGTDLTVKAFREVFPDGSWGDGPVPYLVMKQPKPEDFYGDRIERISGRMTGEAEADLYAEAHCYLQPSRGEGFGLQPLQAIAQGCPTILTNAHGHAAFAQHGMGIGSKLVKAGYFIYGDSGEWWEPDFEELCETMRWTYNNYAEAQERARRGSEAVLSEFTWENTTNGFLDALGRDRLIGYQGSGTWHTPTVKLYRTVTNCHHIADIGGTIYIFEEGDERWMPADVKRILFEAGKLDPECCTYDATIEGAPVDHDQGLSESQVAALPEYIERHSYCTTCHQKFGSGTTLADEIMAGKEVTVPA